MVTIDTGADPDATPTRPEDAPASPRSLGPWHLCWFALVPGAAIVLGAMVWLGPPLARAFYPQARWVPFPSVSPGVAPEPVEQVRYLLSLAGPFVVAGLGLLAVWRSGGQWRWRPWHDAAVVAIQLGALAAVVVCWLAQAQDHRWFSVWNVVAGAVIGGALLAVARRSKVAVGGLSRRPGRAAVWLGGGIALVVTALWLLPAIFSDATVGAAYDGIRYHLQFTMDELLTVLNGRTPMVDYASQYARVLPFVAAPVYALVGSSVGTFTITMWVLSVASMMAVYATFKLVTDDGLVALALYVPFLAVSLIPLYQRGAERLFVADLYQIVPLRVFGPFFVAWLCARHLHRPGRRAVLLFLLAGLLAVNNSEYGLSCFGALYVGLWCGRDEAAGPWARARALAVEAALGGAMALAAVSVVTLATSSSLPSLSYISHFNRVFAIEGFAMWPMPATGLHVIIVLTFVAGLVVALVTSTSAHRRSPVLTGMLAYSSVLGLGAFSYWVGRSHPLALFATFPTWGFTTSLLAWLVFRSVGGRDPRDTSWAVTRALPASAVVVAFGLMASAVVQFPSPVAQARRISDGTTPPADGTATSAVCALPTPPPPPCEWEPISFHRQAAVRFVEANARHGEHVMILASMGHEIARQSGVVNVSPYSDQDAIGFYEQMDFVQKALRRGGAAKVFLGVSYPEIGQWLGEHGFTVAGSDTQSALTEWVWCRGAPGGRIVPPCDRREASAP